MGKFIYLIHAEGTNLYKIGISNNPEKRLKSLQTANPYSLKLIFSIKVKNAFDVEKILHRTFSYCKLNENSEEIIGEWFNLSLDDISSFKEQCKLIELNVEFIKKNSTLKNKL